MTLGPSGVAVWANGKFIKGAAAGVTAGSIATEHVKAHGITFTVGSGCFSFIMECKEFNIYIDIKEVCGVPCKALAGKSAPAQVSLFIYFVCSSYIII